MDRSRRMLNYWSVVLALRFRCFNNFKENMYKYRIIAIQMKLIARFVSYLGFPCTLQTVSCVNSVEGESEVAVNSVEGESEVAVNSVEGESEVVVNSIEGESEVAVNSVEGESEVAVNSVEGESEVAVNSIEGESEVAVNSVEGESEVAVQSINLLYLKQTMAYILSQLCCLYIVHTYSFSGCVGGDCGGDSGCRGSGGCGDGSGGCVDGGSSGGCGGGVVY